MLAHCEVTEVIMTQNSVDEGEDGRNMTKDRSHLWSKVGILTDPQLSISSSFSLSVSSSSAQFFGDKLNDRSREDGSEPV